MAAEAVTALYVSALVIVAFAAFAFQVAVEGKLALKWAIWTGVTCAAMLVMLGRFSGGVIDGGAFVAIVVFSLIAGGWIAIGGPAGIAAHMSEKKDPPQE